MWPLLRMTPQEQWKWGGKVAEQAVDHNTILMANHGVVAWSHLKRRRCLLENGNHRSLLPHGVWSVLSWETELKTFAPDKLKDLLNIKKSLGITDSRFGLKECQLCDNSEWNPGVNCAVPAAEPQKPAADSQAEGHC